MTSEEFLKAGEELKSKRKISNPRMQKILNELNTFGRQQPLSNEEKTQQREKLKSLMVNTGLPAIWYTINPNDLSSPVRVEMGRKFRSSKYHQRIKRKLEQHLLDGYRNKLKEINQDPVTSVIWFHQHVEAFLNEIVRPSTKDGAFGPVDHHFEVMETNQRGAFHLHGFLWFFGNIGAEKLLNDLTTSEDQEEVNEFIRWIDTHFQEDVDFGKSRQREAIPGSNRLSPPDRLKEDLNKLEEEWEDEAHYVAALSQKHCCTATCFKYSRSEKKILKKKGYRFKRKCRFGWPWAIILHTILQDGVLHLKRKSVDCTRWNKVIAAALRHNHDYTFIFTKKKSIALIYYVTNYATKFETPTANKMMLVAAKLDKLRKQPQFVDVDNTDSDEMTRGLMTRISNKIHSERELSAIDVCNHILGYDTFYSSVSNWCWLHCNTIYFAARRQWEYLRKLAFEASEGDKEATSDETVSITDNGVMPSIFQAYQHRGSVFRHLCLYDYASLVQVVKKPKRWMKCHAEFEGSLRTGKYCQRILPKASVRIPVLSGTYPLDFEEGGIYCRTPVIRLALFIPWEKFLSIECDTPLQIWENLSQDLSPRLRNINHNFDLLKRSKDDAILDKKNWGGKLDTDGFENPEDDFDREEHDTDDDDDEEDEDNRELKDLETLRAFSRGITLCMEETLRKGAPVFEASVGNMTRPFEAGESIKIPDIPVAPELDHFQSMKNDVDIAEVGSNGLHTHLSTAMSDSVKVWKNSLTRLNSARLREIAGESDQQFIDHQATGSARGEQGEHQSLQDDQLIGMNDEPIVTRHPRNQTSNYRPTRIIVDFDPSLTWAERGKMLAVQETCNEKQLISIDLILQKLDEVDAERAIELGNNDQPIDNKPQLYHFLGGAGGTGKSRVIRTITRVLQSKEALNRMKVTATSGHASASLDGITIHSTVGLTPSNRLKLSKEKTTTLKDADILVIDECSMLSGKSFWQVHLQLQHARSRFNEDFGGVPIIILSGDFMQFEPVSGFSLLYEGRPTSKETLERSGELFDIKTTDEHYLGHQLWKKFTSTIILTQQMRTQDPEYAPLLERLRNGEQTNEDAYLLNSKLAQPRDIVLDNDTKAITPLNSMRYSINLQATIAFAKRRNQTVYIFLSHHKPKPPDKTAALRKAFEMMDSSNMKVPAYFAFTKGMPVSLTENSHQGLKMVNGAEYTAESFLPNVDATAWPAGPNILVLTRPPKAIFISSKTTESFHLDDLEKGLLPIFPKTINATSAMSVTMSSRPFDRAGFTLTPTFAITDYKVQGQTLQKAYLSLTGRRSTIKGADFMSTYVQLSRVTKLDGVHLLSPIDPEQYTRLRLPVRMRLGMERLDRLDKKTVEMYRKNERKEHEHSSKTKIPNSN